MRIAVACLLPVLLLGCPKPDPQEPTEAKATALPLEGADLAAGAELYKSYCARCHGPEGKGDGPSGANFDIPPTNFTDKSKVTIKDDADLSSWISGGGAAKGKSALMPSFSRSLTPQEIRDVAAYTKSLFAK